MLRHITAKIVKPTVRQLHRRRRRQQFRRCSTDDVDDILLQWSMSPGPPSRHSDTSLQRSLNSPRDSNTDSSVDGGCDGGDDTSSQSSMSPDPPSPKSIATTTQRSSHLVSVTSSHGTMSSDLASCKSDDLTAHRPLCPAPLPYDSNAQLLRQR